MREKLTWDEIKRRYPDEWVILAEPEAAENDDFAGGVVLGHDPDFEKVLAPFPVFDVEVAVLYTAEPLGGLFGVEGDPVA